MSAALNAVYNNYLATYTPKALTRFDTHKKSELRNVYNSIVRINKDAPWYLPTTSKDTQRYAIDLKENARELRNTIAHLGGLEPEGLFSKKSAYTTDESIVTATYIGSENPGTEVPNLDVEVRALASPQENLGLFLPNNKVNLAPDTYSFDVGINNMNYEFQFTVGASETNRSVQERLVRLINNSDIGIQASLAESDGRTALRLVSDASGLAPEKNQIFTVSDSHTSKTSGTVEYFGLDYISREPSNANFLINGEECTTSSNHYTFDKLFELQLHGVSPEDQPTQVRLKTDVESLTDNISHLLGGYNDFVKAASSYLDTQKGSRHLLHELQGIVSNFGSSMESMGVNLTEAGTLDIDKDLLHQTAEETADTNETFGYLKSFSNMLLRKTSQISLNPMEYVEKTIVAYKNPGHNFISPYNTSAYSGMMFNGYC